MNRGEPDRFRTYLHAPLHIRQKTDGRVITVRPVGLLSTANAPQLRDALLKCVADQPTAILVDLELLRVNQIYALSIFSVVARQAALWSGVPLLLIAGHELELQLQSRSLGRFVGIHPTIRAAWAAIPKRPARQLALRQLPHDVRSARTSRVHVAETCASWSCTRLTTEAVAVSDELVSNGLRYSTNELSHRLELRHGLLTVAVTDSNPNPARLVETRAGELPVGGFGLQLVAAYSAAWGSSPTSTGGKAVWAVLR